MKKYTLQLVCRLSDGYELLTTSPISGIFTKQTMSQSITVDGFTPLMVAVKYRRVKFVEEFVQGPYFDKTTLEKSSSDLERTVLHICAEHQDKSITALLLDKVKFYKIDLAPMDVMGNTPLHICAQNDNQYMCEKLLSIAETSTASDSHRTTNPIDSLAMLRIRNNNGSTAFHEATENGRYKIVERMIGAVANAQVLIEECDEHLRTSLHLAALKGKLKWETLDNRQFMFLGNVQILKRFLHYKVNVNVCDLNDHTPLHEAAHWSNSMDEENEDRLECIDCLIQEGAEVNALNLERESPLHIACRYGSQALVRKLLKSSADLLHTNTRGYNCLEVAIEEQNTNVVKYLIDHNYIFELMRNAQLHDSHLRPCCTCGNKRCRQCCCVPCCNCLEKFSFFTFRLCLDRRKVDTPMRKLIAQMPDMAYAILEKCTTTIGSEKSKINKQFFDYEFLEDQYIIYDWIKGNSPKSY